MSEVVLLLLTYALASIPFGLIVGKVVGAVDVRRVGSGNIGTSNVLRVLGKGPAALVLILDTLKGALPVWLAIGAGYSDALVAAVAATAVAGHVWSVFLKFDGGKGIATSLGTMIALHGGVALSLVGVWVGVVALSRFISLASVLAALWLPLSLFLFDAPVPHVYAGIAISAITIWRHRANLQRLRAGREYRFGERVGKAERR